MILSVKGNAIVRILKLANLFYAYRPFSAVATITLEAVYHGHVLRSTLYTEVKIYNNATMLGILVKTFGSMLRN